MPGTGLCLRQASRSSAAAGVTSGTGLGRTASDTVRANADAEGAASSCSEAAQHWSASAWLRARGEPRSCESALCIGQAPPLEQHAIRASGVAIQPAHRATLLAESASATRNTETRWLKFSTVIRMLEPRLGVN